MANMISEIAGILVRFVLAKGKIIFPGIQQHIFRRNAQKRTDDPFSLGRDSCQPPQARTPN